MGFLGVGDRTLRVIESGRTDRAKEGVDLECVVIEFLVGVVAREDPSEAAGKAIGLEGVDA